MTVRFMHPHADRGNDFYETPGCAVGALLQAETLPHHVWEPAAGRGAIVRYCAKPVTGSSRLTSSTVTLNWIFKPIF